MKEFHRIKSISALHKGLGFDPPRHPLLSVVDFAVSTLDPSVFADKTIINDFYVISLKKSKSGNLHYGRQYYDFEEGSMVFLAPAQVFQVDAEADKDADGWGLYFHPDLIVGTSLHDKIGEFTFFDYHNSEALHLSDHERAMIENIITNIKDEYTNNLDQHSQHLIVSNIELILSYCQRFYDRQFLTRRHKHKDVISEFELLLKSYFKKNLQQERGLVDLQYFSESLHLSTSYLSDLVKKETGKTITEAVHLHMIDLAKNSLLSSNKSVSEVAYELGFEYPQYFSRLFKAKVGMSPVAFRNSN